MQTNNTQLSPDYSGYEYKEIKCERDKLSFFLDSYECFGWVIDEKNPPRHVGNRSHLYLRRGRRIANRAELTRLSRKFDSCIDEINYLESTKKTAASIRAYCLGVIGTAFMAAATFAVTAKAPSIPLTVVFAIPGFILWAIPYPVYRAVKHKKTRKNDRLIDSKYDEIFEICEKGRSLTE